MNNSIYEYNGIVEQEDSRFDHKYPCWHVIKEDDGNGGHKLKIGCVFGNSKEEVEVNLSDCLYEDGSQVFSNCDYSMAQQLILIYKNAGQDGVLSFFRERNHG